MPTSALDACLAHSTAVTSFAGQPPTFGTQRALLHVERGAAAVYAELPWRRRDPLPVDPVVLVTGPSGAVVAKATVLAASSEAALISFAADAAGHYHVYWLPHNRQLTGGTCENAYLSTRGRPSRGAPSRSGFRIWRRPCWPRPCGPCRRRVPRVALHTHARSKI